jgi:hypothetical protein
MVDLQHRGRCPSIEVKRQAGESAAIFSTSNTKSIIQRLEVQK